MPVSTLMLSQGTVSDVVQICVLSKLGKSPEGTVVHTSGATDIFISHLPALLQYFHTDRETDRPKDNSTFLLMLKQPSTYTFFLAPQPERILKTCFWRLQKENYNPETSSNGTTWHLTTSIAVPSPSKI